MNTFRTMIVLIAVAILTLLSACSGDAVRDGVSLASSAAYSANDAASYQSLQLSPRVEGCSISERQLLLNEINAEANPSTGVVDGQAIGAWLDGRMGRFTCITH